MRKEFELTESELQNLLALSRPVPAIALNCGEPPSRQQMANDFWQRLGNELGFEYMTARPVTGKGPKFFTAEVEEHTPNEGEPHPATECESRGCVKLHANPLAAMHAEPDISGNDSERLRDFVRKTSLEIKAVGGAGATTCLEMIGYMRELEARLAQAKTPGHD